jgi:hypothetical protein
MGIALIWIESLAAALVLVALVTALAAHWGRFGRWAVPIVVAVGLFAFAAAVTAFTCILHEQLDRHPVSNPQSLSAIAWTVLLGIGSVVLLVRGLRRDATDAAPAAHVWSRAKLAVAGGALIIVTAITFTNMDLAVKVRLAALRAEAGAKTMAILPARLPDSENAAIVYQQAFELLAPPDPTPILWRDKPNAWHMYDRSAFEPKDPELREFMRTQERGLALARKAAAMPGCSFVRDYSKGVAMPLPELNRMRFVANLLAYDALIKAEDGDTHGAVADITAIYGVVGHVNDPLLVAGLAATLVEKIGGKSLEDVLTLSPTAADLGQLTVSDDGVHRRALRSGLVGEEAASMAAFEDLAYLSKDSPTMQALSPYFNRAYIWALMSPYYRMLLLTDDVAEYGRTMGELQRIAGLEYAGSRAGLEAFGKFFKENHGGIGTQLLVPSINKCVERAWEGDARRTLARTALALAAFKAKTGAYPDKLDALVPAYLPAVPLDPFSGRPLRLKRDGTGVVIYSIGPDLTDDGGRPSESGAATGDLVFRLR